jgi:hypothetical protein
MLKGNGKNTNNYTLEWKASNGIMMYKELGAT